MTEALTLGDMALIEASIAATEKQITQWMRRDKFRKFVRRLDIEEGIALFTGKYRQSTKLLVAANG